MKSRSRLFDAIVASNFLINVAFDRENNTSDEDLNEKSYADFNVESMMYGLLLLAPKVFEMLIEEGNTVEDITFRAIESEGVTIRGIEHFFLRTKEKSYPSEAKIILAEHEPLDIIKNTLYIIMTVFPREDMTLLERMIELQTSTLQEMQEQEVFKEPKN